jgi:hypothetical protein
MHQACWVRNKRWVEAEKEHPPFLHCLRTLIPPLLFRVIRVIRVFRGSMNDRGEQLRKVFVTTTSPVRGRSVPYVAWAASTAGAPDAACQGLQLSVPLRDDRLESCGVEETGYFGK